MGVSSQGEPAREYGLGCALKSCGSAYEALVLHSQDTPGKYLRSGGCSGRGRWSCEVGGAISDNLTQQYCVCECDLADSGSQHCGKGRVNGINNRSNTKNGRAVSQTLIPDLQ
jgi:hypothetical protein